MDATENCIWIEAFGPVLVEWLNGVLQIKTPEKQIENHWKYTETYTNTSHQLKIRNFWA